MNANEQISLQLPDARFALTDGRTRPDFMLIGGMKCGTTSFARYLSAHPQVEQQGPKEPHYWTWHRFPRRYQDFFVNDSPPDPPAPEQKISGEFSTSYLIHPLAPRRIRASLPTLKVFVLLRNPVDRAYSHFMMSKRAGLEQACSFEQIVRREIDEVPELLAAHERGFASPEGEPASCYTTADGEPLSVAKHDAGFPLRKLRDDVDLRDFYYQSYVFRSLYHDQLSRWLRLYGCDQVLVMQSEQFFEDSAGTMTEAAGFLGLQPFAFSEAQQLGRRWDAGAGNSSLQAKAYPPMSKSLRGLLIEFFRPHNERLYELIGRKFDWDQAKS